MWKLIFYSCLPKAVWEGVQGSDSLCCPVPPSGPIPTAAVLLSPRQAGEGRDTVTFPLQLCSELTVSVSRCGSALLHLRYCFSLSLPHSPLYISPLHIILPPISYRKFMSLISLRCPLCITLKFLIRHSASCVSQCCSGADLPWRSRQLLCLDTFF